ncbi:uncharacterized protein LOC110097696 [Dendrobium catenatum]|uniref:uncharacterized protein LOC110097696 n=1 Tax=Dendrobium catenatum TaxID=906689 RepID=UPI0010A0530D|nr:uncharacterized protein LOC110097696 [Dendrobium catenatum]
MIHFMISLVRTHPVRSPAYLHSPNCPIYPLRRRSKLYLTMKSFPRRKVVAKGTWCTGKGSRRQRTRGNSPRQACMADPEFEWGLIFNADGSINILRSPCFDVGFEDDATVEEYLERVVQILVSIIGRRFSSYDWSIDSQAFTPSSSSSTFPWLKAIGVATVFVASLKLKKVSQDSVPEEIGSVAGFESPLSPESSYNNWPLDSEDLAKEPPSVPPQLGCTLLNSSNSDENSFLSRPQHVVLNHLFIQKGRSGEPAVALGATHRFRAKYVTMVFYKSL